MDIGYNDMDEKLSEIFSLDFSSKSFGEDVDTVDNYTEEQIEGLENGEEDLL